VFRRLRRPAAALIPVLLLVPALAACGSSEKKDEDSASAGKLDAVSFSGDVGKELKATWHKKVAKPKSTTVTTIVKGSGSKIANGDTVSAYLWIGNGSTKKEAYSDYTNGAPESIPNTGQIGPVLTKLFKNATYGSRVAAVTTPTDLLGSSSGNPQLGIGANDNLVVVADLVKKAAVSPTPKDDKAHNAPASKLPKVVEKKGKPSGLDFAGISKPSASTPVQRVVLKKGNGAVIKETDTVTVNYLGSIYKAKAPFDESYTKKPFTQSLANLVPGWKIGLTGVKAGSRVLLQIPPAYGYGAQGSGSAIPGNATLWFVIDVEKTKK
jgi:FKBP-type peptidyl-prolyl cis-trans isomerase